jgi:integrase
METIKVHVCRQKGRTNLAMRYVDPETGKQVWRTAGTANHNKAIEAAAVWESELREGRYSKRQRINWDDFRDRYDADVLAAMKESTATTYSSTLNVFERMVTPQRLADCTTAKMTAFVTALRLRHTSAATVARHLRQLKVALRWAHRQGLLVTLPKFDRIKQSKGSRGRAVSGEELDRMLAAAPKVVGEAAADSWTFYLRGLDASGLRLSESLVLRWDDAPDAIMVDYSGRHPMLRIDASAEKANTHRLLPMAPEFAELLDTVPAALRRGRVFQPLDRNALPYSATRDSIGPVISAIGEKAGIIVGQRTKADEDGNAVTVPKFASAHDLRRAFGFRWSRRVMPPVLKELMRHTEIATTMKFYVGVNAQATADELWRVAGSNLGSKATKESVDVGSEST